ncbi:MAG: ammonium transporter [Candidatus Melainabacteria bacterium]|nr:ammonium transporter [Candidatus Melainabacteria bacterium]
MNPTLHPATNTGDLAWVLVASSLIMLMTPAVGLFYGGMVHRKNLLSTLMLSFAALMLITLQWVLFGYSLSFGPDINHWIGSLEWFGLEHVGAKPNPSYATNLPHAAFMLFQMKFAIIAPALISGALVERVRFSTYLLFILLWSTVVYAPMAHWVWAEGGWLREMGALDFAGGTVIHITAGVGALAAALAIRPRKGFGTVNTEPNSVPLTLLGAILLWFGWFGFNGGSALAANGTAVHAIITTNVAAAAAALTWMTLSSWKGRPSVIGVATGTVVGLVAITPACGYVTVPASILIGMIAAVVSYYCIRLRYWLKVDETLDVWACHGMAGTWGAIATGLFASSSVNPAATNGLIYGNANLLWAQVVSVVVAWVYAFGVTYGLVWLLNRFRRFTVQAAEEEVGLDISQHGEEAFAIL